MAENEAQGSKNQRKPDRMHGLDNPVRREILRELLDTPDPMSVPDLDVLVPTANVSSLNYHVRVLEREDCIARVSEIVLANGVLPTYSAAIADDVEALTFLEVTRQKDDVR